MHDWKSYWFMIAGAQGLLLSIGLAIRSRKSIAPLTYLAVLLGVLSIEMLTNFATSIQYPNQPGAFPFWVLGSYLLIPSSLFLLARYSINLPAMPRKYIVLLYTPAAIEIITESIMAGLHFYGRPVLQLQQIPAWFIFTEIIPVVATIIILPWWAMQLRKITGKKKQSPSTPKLTRFLPYALLIYYATLSLLWLVEAFFQVAFFGLLEQLLAASLIAVGYISFLRTGIFDRLSFSNEKPGNQWIYNDEETLKKLIGLFETDHLYCQSRLSVDDLAKALHVPSRYVSYLIGTYLKTTATGLINKYRVEEVIRKLKDPEAQNQTILSLAFESGFNSKSAFNQVFKAHTGHSPSQYLQKKS